MDDQYQSTRIRHWDAVAEKLDRFDRANRGYHRRLHQIYRSIIPAGHSVLEIGCGGGDLLAALEPAHGVGVDFSAAMIAVARERHPTLEFVVADAHRLSLPTRFDFIVLSDVLNDLWDIQRVFEVVRQHAHASTRIVMNFYSRLWELPLRFIKGWGGRARCWRKAG
jgi:ubiquinone/menaquinone biosynthesis C-methylase UbiE